MAASCILGGSSLTPGIRKGIESGSRGPLARLGRWPSLESGKELKVGSASTSGSSSGPRLESGKELKEQYTVKFIKK